MDGIDDIYSFYQVKINFKEYENNNLTPKNSRLGWCYGDLGVLYTLLMASIKIGNTEYSKQIIEMLKHVAKREYKNEVFFTDAAFCHGTSGIAILFKNIYEVTKINLFLEASNYWLEQTFYNKRERG